MKKECGSCKLRQRTGICKAENAQRITYARVKKNNHLETTHSTLFKAASHLCDCGSWENITNKR